MMLTLARRTAPAVARASPSRCTARALSSYFAESHEYAKVDGGVATVGITEFAANALGDIVFVDLPEVGDEVEKGESFGAVESVKAASDVYARSRRPRRRRRATATARGPVGAPPPPPQAPITGEVVEVNEALADTPDMVNSSAMEDGWFVKIKVSDEGELGDLMDPAAYEAHIAE